MSAVTKYLPKKGLSRLVGCLMHWQGPKWWAHFSIKNFAKYYKINLSEAEKPISEYASIGDFFIRKLKPDARPVAEAPVLHPADSKLTQFENITDNSLVQAKGWKYSLAQFTQDEKANEKWSNGMFLTYYLCPTDYHRVHSPVSGVIKKARLIPGELWPVNHWSTTHIENLFAINERLLVEIETQWGLVGVMFVGATNVGHICLSFDQTLQGNQGQTQVEEREYNLPIEKGQELGMFRMGSTVVMLYSEKFKTTFQKFDKGPSVKVNSALVL